MGDRIYFTLLALTAPYLLWWANHWNLLGFRFEILTTHDNDEGI